MNRNRISVSGWLSVSVFVTLALLAGACGSLPDGVRVPQSPLSGFLQRKAGLIAYLSTDGNIYTIDQGGQHKTQITKNAFVNSSNFFFYNLPIWSPDSQSIAFVSYSGVRGQNPSSMGLYTARKDGTGVTQALTSTNPLVYWSWAPDGQRLAYIAETPNANLAFQVVNANGANQQLVDAGSPYYWNWAPNSQDVLVHSGGHLSLLRLGQSVTEQSLDVQPADFKAPAYSPDGQQILVAGLDAQGSTALLLADSHGQNVKTLAPYTGTVSFVWSPDGKRVAYVESTDPQVGAPGHLVVVDPSGKAKPVSLPGAQVLAFFWSPDSNSLAYFTQDTSVATQQATPTPDINNTQANSAPFVLKLSVLDAHSGASHSVASYSPSERFMSVLPYFDQYNKSLTIWSPDSRNLVVSAYQSDGTPGVFVVEAGGHLDPAFLADGWMGFWSWK